MLPEEGKSCPLSLECVSKQRPSILNRLPLAERNAALLGVSFAPFAWLAFCVGLARTLALSQVAGGFPICLHEVPESNLETLGLLSRQKSDVPSLDIVRATCNTDDHNDDDEDSDCKLEIARSASHCLYEADRCYEF